MCNNFIFFLIYKLCNLYYMCNNFILCIIYTQIDTLYLFALITPVVSTPYKLHAVL